MIIDAFWKEYIEADELERRKLLESLPTIKIDENGFLEGFTLSLFQIYLEDLGNIIKEMGVK